jgi:hypothetical protein
VNLFLLPSPIRWERGRGQGWLVTGYTRLYPTVPFSTETELREFVFPSRSFGTTEGKTHSLSHLPTSAISRPTFGRCPEKGA